MIGTIALLAASLTAAAATPERALSAASVEVLPGCSGVVAESRQLVVTARHCVAAEGGEVRVRFSTGAERSAWIVAANPASDQAILFLEEDAPVAPLPIARRRPVPGAVLYFLGNPKRPRFQTARLDHLGKCSSLPNLEGALFTTIDGVPGDSGAPLVDGAGDIVGLVHGGARCHIATPAAALAHMVDRLLERDLTERAHPERLGPGRAHAYGLIPRRRILA